MTELFESLIKELETLSADDLNWRPKLTSIIDRLKKERKASDEYHSNSIRYDLD